MLKVRVLTAVVIGPLFLLGVMYLPNTLFAALVGLVILLGAWEWTHISGFGAMRYQVVGVVVTALLMALFFISAVHLQTTVLLLACLFWVVVAGLLLAHRTAAPLAWPGFFRWGCGALVLIPAWLALTLLQGAWPVAALMLLLLIWAADTGAYFAGRRWGRRKLAPAISPGKTLEGVWGALAAGVAVAIGFGVYWRMEAGPGIGLVLVTLGVTTLSIAGDLFESNWKRLASLKDSGGLLPGHGGIMDRIDSMTAAAPFFALAWFWWFGSITA